MEKSIAHKGDMNAAGNQMFPDGLVPWNGESPPDIKKGDRHWTGRLRSCGYCGSMHPADVAAAIRAGATGSWADMKYGWPHKAYFDGIPNPHAGTPEIRVSATYQKERDWVKDGELWRAPSQPASDTTSGKFYTVHLMDATIDDREVIEGHLGLHFEFLDDGKVSWKRVIRNE